MFSLATEISLDCTRTLQFICGISEDRRPFGPSLHLTSVACVFLTLEQTVVLISIVTSEVLKLRKENDLERLVDVLVRAAPWLRQVKKPC